jgi:hypothetical protein
MLIFEGRIQRGLLIKPPQRPSLEAYAASVVRVVDAYLRARGERHLEATVYSHALLNAAWAQGTAGLTAVRFTMAVGAPGQAPSVTLRDGAELDELANRLRGRLQADVPPYLNERRQLHLYLSNDLYVVKPSELRYWSQTAGLNDADIILADHWLATRHAAQA